MKHILSIKESYKTDLKYSFLFTDVKDSSKLWVLSEIDMMKALETHTSRISKITKNNNGIIIKTIGDSFMCKFDNLYDSIKCAIDIQKDIENNPIKIKNKKIELRIGISYGPSIEKESTIQGYKLKDYYGNTVNSASRMESIISDVGGFAFSYAGDIKGEKKIEELISDINVKITNYSDDNKVNFKRSSRLLTDEHNIQYKNIKTLNGVKPVMAYKCNFK